MSKPRVVHLACTRCTARVTRSEAAVGLCRSCERSRQSVAAVLPDRVRSAFDAGLFTQVAHLADWAKEWGVSVSRLSKKINEARRLARVQEVLES